MDMTYMINYWYGSGFASTAPVFRTTDRDAFMEKVAEIRRTRPVMNNRLVEWPGLTIWAYADSKDGSNGIDENRPIFQPIRMGVLE